MANFLDGFIYDTSGLYFQFNSGGSLTGTFALGWYLGDPWTHMEGAARFTGVPINQGQSISEAILSIRVQSRYGSQPVKGKIWGIKETNTDPFGSPGSRPRTTAYVTGQYDSTGQGYWRENVTSIVQEIVNQGGWSSGNALAFYVEDNGTSETADNNYIACDLDPSPVLSIRYSVPGSFTPSPKTVAAPAFSDDDTVGVKIAKKNFDVKIATESQLLFTTQKKVLQTKIEGETTCTAYTEKLIPHGLSYTPQAICYVRKNGYSFELPRGFGGAVDPVGSGVEGVYAVDSTNLKIITYSDADVYYYIFIDPQAS